MPDGQATGDMPAGCMIVVVGPSGAGKDTLMDRAARFFESREQVVFVRRVITRDASAGGEDHQQASERQFELLQRSGGFAVCWRAHGLRYGIPADTRDLIASGRLVIVNGSRSALPDFKAAYPRLTVINVTARPDVLAERLSMRGRESADDINRRLSRSSLQIAGDYHLVTIDNSGEIDAAAQAMINAISNHLPAADY